MEEKLKAIVNCAICGQSEEYDMKPGFPRKYCKRCSEAKKAEYEAKKNAPQPAEKVNDVERPIEHYPRPKPSLMSAKDIHILAQSMVKCVAYNTKLSLGEALDLYHEAVLELEQNG